MFRLIQRASAFWMSKSLTGFMISSRLHIWSTCWLLLFVCVRLQGKWDRLGGGCVSHMRQGWVQLNHWWLTTTVSTLHTWHNSYWYWNKRTRTTSTAKTRWHPGSNGDKRREIGEVPPPAFCCSLTNKRLLHLLTPGAHRPVTSLRFTLFNACKRYGWVCKVQSRNSIVLRAKLNL